MITAEDLLFENGAKSYDDQNTDYRIKSMVEFAKIHVKNALQQASEKIKVNDINWILDDGIVNTYDLNQIQ